jgi:dimethylargininase
MNQDTTIPPSEGKEIHDTNNLTNALIRKPSHSYEDHYTREGWNVSEEFAHQQHQAYVNALESAGLSISYVEPDERCPDGVFIEDTAVVLKKHALITHVIQRRQPELDAIEEALRKTHTVSRCSGEMQLEGGDVLHIGDTTYVGQSGRTNQLGAECLKAFMGEFGRNVVKIQVDNCLHLKSGVTYLGNGTLIAISGWFNLRRFDVEDVLYTQSGEHYAANCLRVRDKLLIPQGCPQTERLLRRFAEKHGVQVIPLDTTEFHKGGGLLTCMSIIW